MSSKRNSKEFFEDLQTEWDLGSIEKGARKLDIMEGDQDFPQSSAKRQRTDAGQDSTILNKAETANGTDRQHTTKDSYNPKQPYALPPLRQGEAPIKEEYRLPPGDHRGVKPNPRDDDEAERGTFLQSGSKDEAMADAKVDDRDRKDDRDGGGKGRKKKFEKKKGGQNKARTYGKWGEEMRLCNSVAFSDEFSHPECKFGDKCKLEHDIRKYLSEGKSADIQAMDGKCPVWDVRGTCNVGWKCRFVGSHSTEKDTADGRKELVLIRDPDRMQKAGITGDNNEQETGVYNVVTQEQKFDLQRKKVVTEKADRYVEWLTNSWNEGQIARHNNLKPGENGETSKADEEKQEQRATYTEPPFLPSEKRRLYYGPETPVLAPLTTQGNLPFRRLCIELGAQVTWSEMAVSLPIIQGSKPEWALMKAHETELTPPRCNNPEIVQGYDNSKDLKFGVQIAANKPWVAFKATEVLAKYLPHLRALDLNCGCPIDMVYKEGAGSALLDNAAKLEKILRGMNTLSGEIPITAKIRMGVRDNSPNADAIVNRLLLGGHDAIKAGLGPCGVAAITLHGRSRQQRYTKLANWEYIADIAALVKRVHDKQAQLTDTIGEADPRHLANGGKVFFMGNGDCYSHIDYYDHIEKGRVDTVMAARGALIKPWLFEEIEKRQYLDKSASERLEYVEKFVKYGLETWGSDETGVNTTRRFLLEWLSFACRYVPIGLLERLPPVINERPPRFRGRNEMETLLCSNVSF